MENDKERTKSDLRSEFAEQHEPVQVRSRVEVARHRARLQSARLQDGDRVAIVGGGPAGSFFAHHLLQESKRLNRQIEVIIIEKRRWTNFGIHDYHIAGCNFCAGGISPRLNEIFKEQGLIIPEEIIQERIEYVWVHGQWKNFRLKVPREMQMYTVFRGSLPTGRGSEALGFDEFLLGEAIREGARVLQGEVQSISYTESGMPRLSVRTPSGEITPLDASFVAIATGINTRHGLDERDNTLLASIKKLNPSFSPGKSRKAFILELDLGEDYLKRNMYGEIHFIEYGSKHLALEHTALVPKKQFLTVAMIGKSIDKAALPQDRQRIIQEFLTLPQIKRILPDIEEARIACACFPRMAVTTARCPFGNRFAIIGDAAGSRLNKDGLFSAHVTAKQLAQTILYGGIDNRSLARGYGKAIKWLAADIRYGRIVFGASRVAFTWPVINRVMYQSFATELKVRDERSRHLGSVLWKIASGTGDYRQMLAEMFHYRTLGSILVGAAVTLRNLAVETLFGLKWGESGRYPTVVLKEKRRAVKQFLSSQLGIELDESPDFERMYVIKIRGSEEEIMGQIAKFGTPDARFLNLRFVDVQRVRGVSNQVGSVIQYRIPLVDLKAELHLTKRAGLQTLLYQLDERLSEHGKLIFSVAPTRDGNSKLSIYAAFNYKRGKSLAGRALWLIARLVFPEFVHDVVWNHALCTIKEDIELHHLKGVGY